MNAVSEVRIDKWLWAVRLYKTRSLATSACRAGNVRVDGERIKPSHSLKVNEMVVANTGAITRTVKVIALLEQRIAAKLVDQYLEDHTSQQEYDRLRERREHTELYRPKGAGRPTKKERRALERLPSF